MAKKKTPSTITRVVPSSNSVVFLFDDQGRGFITPPRHSTPRHDPKWDLPPKVDFLAMMPCATGTNAIVGYCANGDVWTVSAADGWTKRPEDPIEPDKAVDEYRAGQRQAAEAQLQRIENEKKRLEGERNDLAGRAAKLEREKAKREEEAKEYKARVAKWGDQ